MRIAFIGLGAMGVPMAVNLVRAGHEVTGFDVRATALQPLVAAGGKAATSAAEAASAGGGADLLWLMVVTGEQADAVLFEGGTAAALPRGAIVVAACTQAPALAKKTSQRLADMGLEMLDAPVSGGVAGANAAGLTIMVSGAEATLARARSVFEAVGKRIFDVGREAGMGSTAKMINQLLAGVHIATACEAMALGIPVVSTRVNGIPEAVLDGVTGLLVEPGQVQALARAVTALLNDATRRENMSAAGRAHARLFHADAMVRTTFGVYAEATAAVRRQ